MEHLKKTCILNGSVCSAKALFVKKDLKWMIRNKKLGCNGKLREKTLPLQNFLTYYICIFIYFRTFFYRKKLYFLADGGPTK